MIKRGRKSVGDLSVVPMSSARLQPPGHLTVAQAVEWRQIVDSLPADYFRPGDVPLLSAFCVASAFYKRAAADLEKRGLTLEEDRGRLGRHEMVNPSHQVLSSQASAMAQMAVKLRLCPSSRYSEKNAATKAGAAAKPARPWEQQEAVAG
jgi:P27 family predicted phage terminase small subunit